MKELFRQEIYKDKWMLLIGIPLISLLMQHVGLSWETTKAWVKEAAYWSTLAYNLLGVTLILFCNKALILWLDRRLPYQPRLKRRISLQLILSLLLTLTIGELHSYLYIYAWNDGATWESQYTTDLPFAVLITILLNLIYIGFYLQYSSRSKPAVPPEGEAPTTLEVSLGNKKLLLRRQDIALFAHQDKLTQVYTFDGKRYLSGLSLKQVGEQLGPPHFFQANRQVILNRKAVQGFQKLPSRKLEIILQPDGLFAAPIQVSKEKATRFQEWLSA
ncbi:MAG: LytTR family transcriptional regulator [Phaeodactylibacter sp.]|nr:LytTR family transcriptional regulator [Phaeodactylibacter sp.]